MALGPFRQHRGSCCRIHDNSKSLACLRVLGEDKVTSRGIGMRVAVNQVEIYIWDNSMCSVIE